LKQKRRAHPGIRKRIAKERGAFSVNISQHASFASAKWESFDFAFCAAYD